jgi:S1 RNA binding domain protein
MQVRPDEPRPEGEAIPSEAQEEQTVATEVEAGAVAETPVAAEDEVGTVVEAATPIATEVEVGAVVEGTVQRITPYGAFLTLPGGKIGLVHISEIDRNYVKDVREHLRETDVVQAKVISIKDDGKIDLSIKALQDPQPRIDRRRGRDPEFEQKLKRFLRQSEERQVDFKRSVEHKRR